MPNTYIQLLSCTLFFGSFIAFYSYGAGKANKIFFSLFAFFYISLFALYKVADYFTGHGIDQATIVQMKFGLEGAALAAYSSLIETTIGILLACVIALAMFVLRAKVKKNSVRKKCVFAYVLMIIAVYTNPAVINFYDLPKGTFIPHRAASGSTITEFYKYYKKPQLQSVSAKHKNLVVIYAESLEQAFFNEDVFPDLVPRLKEIEKQSISFSNMHMANGTGGTIWAISASLCGLPLFLPNLAILNKGTGEFLPEATCLGDILEDEGYYLTYYGGASLEFTGKGNFFSSHGFSDVLGRHELLPLLDNKEYLNHWGLYDDSLFDIT